MNDNGKQIFRISKPGLYVTCEYPTTKTQFFALSQHISGSVCKLIRTGLMTYYSATIIKRVSERLLIIYSADFFQVISASSDGTVKAWNPHATTLGDASTIGTVTMFAV